MPGPGQAGALAVVMLASAMERSRSWHQEVALAAAPTAVRSTAALAIAEAVALAEAVVLAAMGHVDAVAPPVADATPVAAGMAE
jgi:hypothetical protein